MTRRFLFFILILFTLPACYQTYENIKPDPSSYIINRDTMVLILADVEIAESALRQMQNIGKETGDLSEAYYHNIFSKYQVDKARFDSSMVFYRQDPEVINKIYEDVITRLSLMESEIKMEEE